MKKDDVEYLLRIVEPDIAAERIRKDNSFMLAAIIKLSEYEIRINIEPPKILSYILGLFCLFFKQLFSRKIIVQWLLIAILTCLLVLY